MNKMKKLVTMLVALLPISAFATDAVVDSFSLSSSGTTSATVIVPKAEGFGEVTDLGVRFDVGVTTGFVAINSGSKKLQVTSAVSASTSVVYFNNSDSDVAAQEYIIVLASGNYYLHKANSITTTSATIQGTLAVALTTSDVVWSVDRTSQRPVTATQTSTTAIGSIWIPSNVPTAFTVDGNTTACRISVSGVRSNYK